MVAFVDLNDQGNEKLINNALTLQLSIVIPNAIFLLTK